MIKSTLPVLEQSIIDGKLVSKERMIDIYIDPSLYAETRWEQNFPKQAEIEGLFEYVERIHKEKKKAITVPVAISMLKAVYCFLEIDKTWAEFQKEFVFNDDRYAKHLSDSIINVFNIVLNGSAEKN